MLRRLRLGGPRRCDGGPYRRDGRTTADSPRKGANMLGGDNDSEQPPNRDGLYR